MNKRTHKKAGIDRDSWRTPNWLYEALDKEFGFDLDPCPFQPNWTPGIHQNGLDLDWNGHRVFCNPPYSNILPWVEKAYASSALTVFLLPSRTDTAWYHILHDHGAEIRHYRKRINFVAPKGIKSSTNNCGSTVAIVRNFPEPTPAPVPQLAVSRKPERIEAISIAQYAGRKQWFLPHAFRHFQNHRCQTLIEPFAGSGVVGLSLLYAGVIDKLVLVEKDERLVCMHEGILNDPTFIDRYADFECTKENVRHLFRTEKTAFRYLVQTRVCNRAKFDGGLRSNLGERLCKEMVIQNIQRARLMRDRITVIHSDALEEMRKRMDNPNVGCFADVPYTSEPGGGGHRLYRHRFAGRERHRQLFSLLSQWRGAWLLTEDNCRTVRRLAHAYRFTFKRVRMNGSENKWKKELMIWRKRTAF